MVCALACEVLGFLEAALFSTWRGSTQWLIPYWLWSLGLQLMIGFSDENSLVPRRHLILKQFYNQEKAEPARCRWNGCQKKNLIVIFSISCFTDCPRMYCVFSPQSAWHGKSTGLSYEVSSSSSLTAWLKAKLWPSSLKYRMGIVMPICYWGLFIRSHRGNDKYETVLLQLSGTCQITWRSC